MRLGATWRVVFLYALLTCLLAYPLTRHPTSTMLADDPDAHLFVWTLGWDAHAFLHQPLAIFDANIYFPQRFTLAYSENLIGSALIAAPVIWLTGNHILALNVVILLSCVLCGLGTYVLVRRLGAGVAGATLAGMVFAFSPARFYRLSQLHLAPVQWIPFTLAYLHAYLDGGRKRDLRIAVAFFSLQALTSGHGAAFASVAVGLLLVYRAALGEPLAPLTRIRDLGVVGVLLLVPAALIYLPYRAVQAELHLVRGLDIGTPTPESFVASPTALHTYLNGILRAGPHVNDTASAFLFPGYVPILLALAALLWFRRPGADASARPAGRPWSWAGVALEVAALVALGIAAFVTWTDKDVVWRTGGRVLFQARAPLNSWLVAGTLMALRLALTGRAPLAPWLRMRHRAGACLSWVITKRTDATAFYALLTAVAVGLSMAPPHGLWPYVYHLPGFSLIRVSSRFMILGTLGVAVLAGLGFDRVAGQWARRPRQVLGVVLGAVLVAEFWGVPLQTYPFALDTPAVEQWLDRQPKPFAVAELPWPQRARYQTLYMLHAMGHWQKTVQGYSGMEAPLSTELNRLMRTFPDERSAARLTNLGVTYVVVHRRMYSDQMWEDMDRHLKDATAWLTLVHEEDEDRVYALQPTPP